MNTQREQLIQAWLNSVLNNEPFDIHFLAGDASFRRYARVQHAGQSYMLMDAPPEKEDCGPFVQIDRFFAAHAVRVPKIIAEDLAQGFLLLEDFGDVLLSSLLNADTVDGYYLQAFKQLVALQHIDATGVLPAYSHEKLLQEMQLFTEWLLPALDVQPTADENALIENTFKTLADNASSQPQVIVHRDFHSRNLMALSNETDLGVIDFQDAVIGAYTYDLISITRDAYVQWQPEQVNAWFEQFYALLPASIKANISLDQFKRDADYMAIQRHLKILGIFVRLFERDGKSGYLKDLPRVMWYLLQEAKAYPELNEFIAFVETRVLSAFNTKYGTYTAV